MPGVLDGVRVLERPSGIAGAYCGKVLTDAGADVVKVEGPDGDPLRRHGAGALFEYLSAGKRSVVDDRELLDNAHVVIGGDAGLRDGRPHLIVVGISPFGPDGPWADRPTTEFVMQAACGSTGSRGLPEQAPLAGGGRFGDWIAGTYAAVATLACLREAGRSGQGEHIDVAELDCMAVTMTTYTQVFGSFLGFPPMTGTGRMIEVPSVEPTADGYAVFTTNSAQQFHDFLLLIQRPDLVGDESLARVLTRFGRRAEFLPMVHAFTAVRPTDEVLDAAAELRIPSGPVLHGDTIPVFRQFVERGVFRPSASGRFVQPRPPYRINGEDPPAPRPSPPGPGIVTWPAMDRSKSTGDWQRPLAGIRVIDCTAWWAGPIAAHALACMGADVIKVESITRPDLMRYSATKPPSVDRWWEWGPIYHAANAGKRGITLDLTRSEGVEVFERLAATADLLIENYTPRVMDHFGLGWDHLHELNPSLIMVRMPAFGLDGPWRDRTGFAQTMECVTGMAWLTGFPDGPPVLLRGACDPTSGLHATIGALIALRQRDDDGQGRLVEATMVEAALNVAAEQVVERSAGGPLRTRDGNRGPDAVPQGVYPCAGEDTWVAVAASTEAEWTALAATVDPAWLADPDLADPDARRKHHDRLDTGIAAWTRIRASDEAAETLGLAGVPAAVVVAARDIAFNPQLRHRRLFEVEEHPVTGSHELPAFPVRLSRVDSWHPRSSPALGQHNDEVLTELGLGLDEIQALRELGVIGERVAGL